MALSEVVVASFDSDPDQGCPLGRLQSGSIILEGLHMADDRYRHELRKMTGL